MRCKSSPPSLAPSPSFPLPCLLWEGGGRILLFPWFARFALCSNSFLSLSVITAVLTYLAGVVNVFDRHGAPHGSFALPTQTAPSALDWDSEGEVLAVAASTSSNSGGGSVVVLLWHLASQATQTLETNLRGVSFMAWARRGPHLAVGDSRGNLLLYNKQSRRKVPVLGKHARAILCGGWSLDNRLALGSADNTLSIR